MITARHGVPLDHLLRGPLDGARLLAARSERQRMVTGIREVDGAGTAAGVAPGDLVVVDRDVLGEHLAAVLDPRPAAVGVRLGRRRLPTTAAREAESAGVPVVALPPQVGFQDLVQHVYAGISAHQTEVLARIDALHQGLSQLVLAGGDLDEIAAQVATVLDVGIIVTSTDGREWVAAVTAEHRDLLDLGDLVDPTGRVRVERARDPLTLAGGEVRAQPITAAGTELARLVCVSPGRSLSPDDVQALERAGMVAALLITRRDAVTAVENKYRGDFLRDIFLGRAGTPAFVREHSETFGWDLDRPMVVISAELDPASRDSSVPSRVSRAWQERFSAAWRQVCRGHDPGIPSVDFSTEVVTLFPAGDEPDRTALRAAVAEVVGEVAGDRGGGRRPFSVGVSRVVRTLDELPAAYEQARRATRIGRRISGERSTTWFDDLGVHRLIGLVPDEQELRGFAEDVLGELAGTSDEAADLRTTLQHLLDTNFNVAEAARLQYFHYNTMRYRVGKLERILGPFASNPHLRLNIAVALQVLELTRQDRG